MTVESNGKRAPLLDRDWGIIVDNRRRVLWIDPDRQKADTLTIKPSRFTHMPARGFADNNPVGAAMRGTRFLINDACPIEFKKELPAGVKVEPILQIPNRENYIAAKLPEMLKIIDEVRKPETEGRVTLTPFPDHGPFDVMVAAERQVDGKSKGKIVVLSFGDILTENYLEIPVMASGPGEALRLEPPATEGVDLFVNTLYWLQGRNEYIARGPAPVPQVAQIDAKSLLTLRVFVYGLWPLVMFAPGVVLWWIRRR